jgi:PAS domain S-box-containing protein
MSNHLCETTLGLDSSQLAGTVLDDLMPAHERSTVAAQLPVLPWPVYSGLFECINRQGKYSAEHQLRTIDGSYRSYLFEATVLHSPQGKHEGAVVSATDITQIKQQQVRLLRSESLLKEAQQYAHMGSSDL